MASSWQSSGLAKYAQCSFDTQKCGSAGSQIRIDWRSQTVSTGYGFLEQDVCSYELTNELVVDTEVEVVFKLEQTNDALVYVLSGESTSNLTETKQVVVEDAKKGGEIKLDVDKIHVVIVQASTQRNAFPFAKFSVRN